LFALVCLVQIGCIVSFVSKDLLIHPKEEEEEEEIL
jgi:hypothetical protein